MGLIAGHEHGTIRLPQKAGALVVDTIAGALVSGVGPDIVVRELNPNGERDA